VFSVTGRFCLRKFRFLKHTYKCQGEQKCVSRLALQLWGYSRCWGRTQREDSSWYVKSRSRPFQTYFESGFPHGSDQFISAAASGWAVAGLAQSYPTPDEH
jgi:hypothetical protein